MKKIHSLQGIEVTKGRSSISIRGALFLIGRAVDSEVTKQVVGMLGMSLAIAGIGYLGVVLTF